ncbi:hypothetical protein NST28_15915 [Paenibacillus sp. FSL R10-2791]
MGIDSKGSKIVGGHEHSPIAENGQDLGTIADLITIKIHNHVLT